MGLMNVFEDTASTCQEETGFNLNITSLTGKALNRFSFRNLIVFQFTFQFGLILGFTLGRHFLKVDLVCLVGQYLGEQKKIIRRHFLDYQENGNRISA